jgi:hypothetical protein
LEIFHKLRFFIFDFLFVMSAGAALCGAFFLLSGCENIVDNTKNDAAVYVSDEAGLLKAVDDPLVGTIVIENSFDAETRVIVQAQKTIIIPIGKKLGAVSITSNADVDLKISGFLDTAENKENQALMLSEAADADEAAGVLLIKKDFTVKEGANFTLNKGSRLVFTSAKAEVVVDGGLFVHDENAVYHQGEAEEILSLKGSGKIVVGSNTMNIAELEKGYSITALTGGEDGGKTGEAPQGGNESPALKYTNAITFAKTINNTSRTVGPTADEHIASYDNEGPEAAWTISVVEEPTVWFAVNKTAGQNIIVQGPDAAKVTPAESGTAVDGSTAGDTLAVFSVDMEDLLFDGAFGGPSEPLPQNLWLNESNVEGKWPAWEPGVSSVPGGKETRSFTLTAGEKGKKPVTVAVNLDITLDDTGSTIYKKENGRWNKVREALASTAIPENYADIGQAKSFTFFTPGRVEDLWHAFIWVDQFGTGGTGEADETNGLLDHSRTKKDYSRYRIFIKKDQGIGKAILKFLNKDYISVELYGAGRPGAVENKIMRDERINTEGVYISPSQYILNPTSIDAYGGLITVGGDYNPNTETRHNKALILEKNITLDGRNEDFDAAVNVNNTYSRLDVYQLLSVGVKAAAIMRPYSKITGVKGVTTLYCHIAAIGMTGESYYGFPAALYIQGGAIVNNSVSRGIIYLNYSDKSTDNIIELEKAAVISNNYAYSSLTGNAAGGDWKADGNVVWYMSNKSDTYKDLFN